MVNLSVTEKEVNSSNLLYAQSSLSELSGHICFSFDYSDFGDRCGLTLSCPEYYADVVSSELNEKLAEIVAIKYKYDYFKKYVKTGGLKRAEYEILIASLIAADLEEDKKYVYEKLKGQKRLAIDGVFNFRLKQLKKKWEEIVSYMPTCFLSSQLKDFIFFMLENKKKRVFVDNGKVYDNHFRKLNRVDLIGGDCVDLIREIILSNCGEVEISGKIPDEDEKYLKEYYGNKIVFSERYFG